MVTNGGGRKVGEEDRPRNRINLSPFRRFYERSMDLRKRHLEPYVKNGQVVADLGCNTGYYTLALAECVGPEGRVYVVDLDEKMIRSVEGRAEEGGYQNIEAHATSAADLSFIEDGSVDFVLANGLL